MSDNGEAEPTSFQVTAYRCRCGHEWVPSDLHQTERPRVCPKCKSPNWDRPYLYRRPDLQGKRVAYVGLTSDPNRKKNRR